MVVLSMSSFLSCRWVMSCDEQRGVYSFPSLVMLCELFKRSAPKGRSNPSWLVCVCVASGNMHQWRLTSKKTHGYKNTAAWQLDPFLLKWNSSRNPKKQSTYSVKYCKHQMAIFRNQHMNQPTIDHIYNLQEKQWITKHISKQFRMNIQI